MLEAKILGKGQLVIPAEIRKKLGLKPGDSVRVLEYDGAIHVIPTAGHPIRQAIGILPSRPSLLKKLLKDRAAE